MGKRLEDALQEAEDIEIMDQLVDDSDEADAPIPPHVKVSRPGRARSKVLQVRLYPEEFAAIRLTRCALGRRPHSKPIPNRKPADSWSARG